MKEERPFLSIPPPSEEDMRLYEEWLRKQEQKQKDKENNDKRVIVIDI
tara:strand:+ start:432 stop:575 length:144 start_codon:yes stop_codon:yes gene_type:complete